MESSDRRNTERRTDLRGYSTDRRRESVEPGAGPNRRSAQRRKQDRRRVDRRHDTQDSA